MPPTLDDLALVKAGIYHSALCALNVDSARMRATGSLLGSPSAGTAATTSEGNF